MGRVPRGAPRRPLAACGSGRVQAPKDGRATTRIRWLLRQLKDAPAGTRIEVSFPNARDTTSCLVREALDDSRLLYPADPKREPRAFRVAITQTMGRKGGSGDNTFVKTTSRQIVGFYGDLVQGLHPWTPRAPRLKTQDDGEAPQAPGTPTEVETPSTQTEVERPEHSSGS